MLPHTPKVHCPHVPVQGFRIGEFALKFRINLSVTTVTATPAANGTSSGSSSPPGSPAASPPPPPSGSSGSGSATQVLSLTPSQPLLRDASKRVSARLVGDLVGYQQEAQLDGKWLMVPFDAGESCCCTCGLVQQVWGLRHNLAHRAWELSGVGH